MPYTRNELQGIGYYQEFVDRVRDVYLEKLEEAAKKGFRDTNNVLLSFENIFEDATFKTGLSIEDVDIDKEPYLSILRKEYAEGMPEDEIKTLEDLRQLTYTRQFSKYPEYIRGSLLEKIIDRNISELSESRFIEQLPGDLVDGDVITLNDADDLRKWLVENGQKRIFPDLATFFGYGYNFVDLVGVDNAVLQSIPSGDDVE